MLLGCIADDFTGATDLGSMLVRGGLRTVQWLGVPEEVPSVENVDAVVISLKSRSVPAGEAVRESLAGLATLQDAGAQRFFFKYCSTFDSTDEGNIGPVAEALMHALEAKQTIFCPAFPENGRTVYQGHLFVGDRLLNESGMENHPLNPMTDANLVRVLARQTSQQVGVVRHQLIQQGAESIREELSKLASAGVALIVADAIEDEHLTAWAEAVVDQPLVTGGSALGQQLAKVFAERGMFESEGVATSLPSVKGKSAVLAGSCSQATLRQVQAFGEQRPVFVLDPQRLAAEESLIDEALRWAYERIDDGPVLITSTATSTSVDAARKAVGNKVSSLVEQAFAQLASALVDRGVRKLVVAGGETSGAVLNSLGVRRLRIGPEIDPGVPWTESLDEPHLALALKSGNFGDDDFFLRALEMLS